MKRQPETSIFVLKLFVYQQYPFLEMSPIDASRHILGVEICQIRNEKKLLLFLLLQINPYLP
jgi:hypothetical protein